MATESDFEKFNAAMSTILKTDPKMVKAQMVAAKEERQRKRAKGKSDGVIIKPDAR